MTELNKKEITDKLKLLVQKRNEKLEELNKLQEELAVLMNMYYLLDDSYVKVICIGCSGTGYTKDGDKKVLCKVCAGKQYNWMTRYKENKNAI